jgi:peptidoglycan/LPS O-acetylase OafA/YrhL
MPLGLTLLVVASILVLFGVGHQVLDRMRLNDKTALLFMAGIFVGGLLPDISLGDRFSINLGGAVIPFILVVYLFVKAGTAKEKWRAVLASLVSGAAIYIAGRLLPHDPETMWFDPNYAYGIIAGITAYLFGRSRRASFIAGIMGVILADIAQLVENTIRGIPSPIRIGSAGAVDILVISGLLAVLLAEVVGELRERLQGGTEKKHMRFDHGEFTSAMGAEDLPEQSEIDNWAQVDEDRDILEQDEQPDKEGNP